MSVPKYRCRDCAKCDHAVATGYWCNHYKREVLYNLDTPHDWKCFVPLGPGINVSRPMDEILKKTDKVNPPFG